MEVHKPKSYDLPPAGLARIRWRIARIGEELKRCAPGLKVYRRLIAEQDHLWSRFRALVAGATDRRLELNRLKK